MDNQATYDDVNLILKLYELRRDDRLREARKWFGGLKVKTLAELQAACPPGSEQDASVRIVTSYWEIVASFITSGVFNQNARKLGTVHSNPNFIHRRTASCRGN